MHGGQHHSGHTHLALDQAKIPYLLHQSWKSEHLPSPTESWRQSMLDQNAGWQLVHWTDDDNAALVQTHAPWLQDIYDKLHGVYRADMVSCHRNYYLTRASTDAHGQVCSLILLSLASSVHRHHQRLYPTTQHVQHQIEGSPTVSARRCARYTCGCMVASMQILILCLCAHLHSYLRHFPRTPMLSLGRDCGRVGGSIKCLAIL